jgi:drug/metabolite transporter (DMT)-like permease
VDALVDRRSVDTTGALLALLTSVFWGANTVAIKVGLADAPPLRLAWMRFVVGGAAIALWAWATGRLAGLRIAPAEWRPMIVLALIFTAQIGTMNIGTALTSAAHASILLNLYSVHTVVLSHFLIPGDRLTVRKLAGVAVAYAGIVLLFAGQAGGGPASLLGDVIVFVSAFLLAERLVYLARAVQRLDPVKLLLSQAAIGSVLFMVGSALTEPTPTRWTVRLGVSIAYQGVLIAGFIFVVNMWLLQRYRPSSLVPFFLTQPLFGVVAAAVVTGDPLTWELFAAGVAVAIGMGLTTR